MTIETFAPTFARLLLAAVCLASSVSCGGELLRTGRAPVYLIIDNLLASGQAVLRSDVVDAAGVAVDDLGTALVRAELKNPSIAATPINGVTLTRYRVGYRRTDGRNTPGVDVPFGFDGALNVTLSPGAASSAVFQLVRQQGKLEPPLRNLRGGGGLVIISTIADVTFFGRDQNGNEVTVAGNIDVQFGDF